MRKPALGTRVLDTTRAAPHLQAANFTEYHQTGFEIVIHVRSGRIESEKQVSHELRDAQRV